MQPIPTRLGYIIGGIEALAGTKALSGDQFGLFVRILGCSVDRELVAVRLNPNVLHAGA